MRQVESAGLGLIGHENAANSTNRKRVMQLIHKSRRTENKGNNPDESMLGRPFPAFDSSRTDESKTKNMAGDSFDPGECAAKSKSNERQ